MLAFVAHINIGNDTYSIPGIFADTIAKYSQLTHALNNQYNREFIVGMHNGGLFWTVIDTNLIHNMLGFQVSNDFMNDYYNAVPPYDEPQSQNSKLPLITSSPLFTPSMYKAIFTEYRQTINKITIREVKDQHGNQIATSLPNKRLFYDLASIKPLFSQNDKIVLLGGVLYNVFANKQSFSLIYITKEIYMLELFLYSQLSGGGYHLSGYKRIAYSPRDNDGDITMDGDWGIHAHIFIANNMIYITRVPQNAFYTLNKQENLYIKPFASHGYTSFYTNNQIFEKNNFNVTKVVANTP